MESDADADERGPQLEAAAVVGEWRDEREGRSVYCDCAAGSHWCAAGLARSGRGSTVLLFETTLNDRSLPSHGVQRR